jgi:glucokinase
MPLRHSAMLEVNEYLVLDFVRGRQRTSRPEIGRSLDLSPASVSRIVGRLLKAGLVVEDGSAPTSGGRPAAGIVFNPRAGAVLAVDLGAAECHGALADLAGNVLYTEVRPTRQHGTAFATLLAVVDELATQAREEGVVVAALAVGVPAIVDPETGTGIAGPSVAWERFEISTSLRDHVDVPFLVENDVNLAALAQAWRGEGRQAKDFVTLHFGHGVGGAVVANGRLVKGHHHAGGEVGYLVLDRAQLGGAFSAGTGALESLVTRDAIIERYRAAAGLGASEPAGAAPGPGAAAGPGADGQPITLESILAGARDGRPAAEAIVEELLDLVLMAIVAVAAVVDPQLVILDGEVGRALEPFVERIEAGLQTSLPRPPRVVVSRLLGNSALTGAVAAALQLARERSAPTAFIEVFAR